MNAGKAIKVGFGPITAANSFLQSGIKVAQQLANYSDFETGFFSWEPFQYNELSNYDILVFIKYIPDAECLATLKAEGKILLLDYHDTFLYPSVYEQNIFRRLLKRLYYFKTEPQLAKAFSQLDGCLICTPLLCEVVSRAGMLPLEVPRQIYNDGNEYLYKQSSPLTEGVVLYWTGVSLNQSQNDPILSVLKKMHDNYGCRILYDTDRIGEHEWIEYRMFNNDTWAFDILDADIAFRWRDTSNLQRFKDANKVQSYMAAGLPVVVHPTASEKLIIKDGKTGFFAETSDQFEEVMIKLILNPTLRHEVGKAAHSEVWERCALSVHVEQIRKHILKLLQA
jgi:glycosyltransferase involved in cell wall biosynthesis